MLGKWTLVVWIWDHRGILDYKRHEFATEEGCKLAEHAVQATRAVYADVHTMCNFLPMIVAGNG